MKPRLLKNCLFLLLLLQVQGLHTSAQCAAGYTRDTLNWDYLDFLSYSGAYISPTPFLTLGQSQKQAFTLGTQTVSVTHNFTGANTVGDVTTHTAEAGSYGAGATVALKGNGSITFTFSQPVLNLQFSIYDIDRSQKVKISALDGATGTEVDLATLRGTILSTLNNYTPTATVSAAATNVANADDSPLPNGTVNVDISGPVTSFTLNVSGTTTDATEDGAFYISDISACSAGTFPLNYYNISKPFIGQPAYFLAVRNNNVYYVNVSNGVARLLFKDNTQTNINSLAYDPYRHMVYYSYSLTSSPINDKAIHRFDYDMDTMGIFINNVNTLGIPTFESGVESGAAAYYNGCYYLGVEGTNMGDNRTNRESIVWKIDFDRNYAATTIAQVFAVPSDDGAGTGVHDWGDIGINDGILYDFDGASGQTDFYHKSLLEGSVAHYSPNPGTLVPRQVSVDWKGQMYNSGSPGALASGSVAPYNGDGSVNISRLYPMTYQGVAVTGSWGDAGEAFKPKTDYGDAPASYDPAGVDPGTHERNDSIYFGTKPGIEWTKHVSADATGDGPEEDGITTTPVIAPGVSNFTIGVKAYNNTGRNATVVGWIDANGNGVFESSEGTTLTIPSSASMQNITLLWTAINVTRPANSYTFMRIRIATADQNMSIAKPNGYYDNGEIEDYQVTVSIILPQQALSLDAKKIQSSRAQLNWTLNQEVNNTGYSLQRSADGTNWQTITNRIANGSPNPATYHFTDETPVYPVSYYKVKVIKNSGHTEFSEIRKVDFNRKSYIVLTPNPAKSTTTLKISSAVNCLAMLQIIDYSGRVVYECNVNVTEGANELNLPVVAKFSNGLYKVRMKLNDELCTATLMMMK